MWRGGLDCCALHLYGTERAMNYYAENPKITLRVSIGDAMFIGDVMPSKAENGEKPEK